MAERGHLRVVTEQGELLDECPECAELQRELARFRKITSDLRRDREAEARANKLWPDAVTLFNEWKIATGKKKSKWGGQRFWLVEPYLRADGFTICRWAVWGIAYRPNFKDLPDGHREYYQDWELCFKHRGNFERYARRGYMNPEARRQFSLREQGIGPDDERIDPNKHFAAQ